VPSTAFPAFTSFTQEVGKDEEKDVAVLRLEGVTQEQREALTPLTLGSSSSLMVRASQVTHSHD
jgi:S1-C subfamily serine protease